MNDTEKPSDPTEEHNPADGGNASKNTTPAGAASTSAEAATMPLISGPALDAARRVSDRFSEIQNAVDPTRRLAEQMRSLTEIAQRGTAFAAIAEQIEKQNRALDAARVSAFDTPVTRPTIRELPLPPPNPLHETNDRLGRIEERFERMLDVAANGAGIATALQTHAATLLAKFESAATDNDRATKGAIRIGTVAVVIAIAMPIFQVLYTEFWRVPADTASMAASVAEMRREVASLRASQLEAAERIATALERSDRQTAEALREVARSLVGLASTGRENQGAPVSIPR